MRYLALGDSYTIGEGVPDDGRWPLQLAQRLRARGLSLAEPQIVARTGWTTDELDAAMDAAELRPPYDLVSLLIGVNNQYRGRDIDNYRDEFRKLLARAIELAGARSERVLVVSIPDWGITPFAQGDARGAERIGREIDTYNQINATEAAHRGAAWVDVTAFSRQPGADLLVADQLHPSARQYAGWVDCIEPLAARIFGVG